MNDAYREFTTKFLKLLHQSENLNVDVSQTKHQTLITRV